MYILSYGYSTTSYGYSELRIFWATDILLSATDILSYGALKKFAGCKQMKTVHMSISSHFTDFFYLLKQCCCLCSVQYLHYMYMYMNITVLKSISKDILAVKLSRVDQFFHLKVSEIVYLIFEKRQILFLYI